MNHTSISFSYLFTIFPHFQAQIISTIFLVILEITYFKRRKIPVISSKIFSFLMGTSIIYTISEFLLAISIFNPNLFPKAVNAFFQALYTLSILALMMEIYLYIAIFNSEEQKLSFYRSFIALGLFFVSIFLFAFSALYFLRVGNSKIIAKPLRFSILTILIIYTLIIILNSSINIFKQKSHNFRKKQFYVLWTMLLWIFTLITQVLLENTIISSVGLTAMIFIMYIGMETPDEYIDQESEALNSLALKLVLQQNISRNKDFFIINLDVEELNSVEKQYGEEVRSELSVMITDFLSEKLHTNIYHAKPHSFTMIIPYHSSMENSSVIDFLLNSIYDRMQFPWLIEKHQIKLDCHCDFLFYPNDVPKGMAAKELINFTDEWHTYSDETGFIRRVNNKLIANKQRQETILSIVRSAIEKNEIEMFYQPIYNIKEGKFTNTEALVRLKDKTTIGFISPEEFIPLAERNNLIMELSDRIFNQVFEFMSENELQNKGIKHVEMNLSALQSVDAGLPEQINNLILKYNLNPQNINLEITESMAVTAGNMLKENIKALKALGCSFSMDDFGTGYSNLSQMAKVDYELIKIDKSLLWPCFDEKNSDKENAIIILENMITMILKLGKQIVVEGVETEEQFNYLKKLGATYIQGYYFSKPLNQQDYLKFLEENN